MVWRVGCGDCSEGEVVLRVRCGDCRRGRWCGEWGVVTAVRGGGIESEVW